MKNFYRKGCRSWFWKFLHSAQKLSGTVIKTVNYMFDTTFLRIFLSNKVVFELKFAVDCGTWILDVQMNNFCRNSLECAGISLGLEEKFLVVVPKFYSTSTLEYLKKVKEVPFFV